MKTVSLVAALLAAGSFATSALADPIPASFASSGPDRAAIQAVLDTYTKAVSEKKQALFESILLNTDIPFSHADEASAGKGTRNYAVFRRSVFGGAPFTQRFQDVHVEQDGSLAQVSLVFVNTSAEGSSWGFKTLHLLKVGGQWKIASEFFTSHPVG